VVLHGSQQKLIGSTTAERRSIGTSRNQRERKLPDLVRKVHSNEESVLFSTLEVAI
jgi:hypothetical protein